MFKEKAIKIVEDLLSSVGKKDDPIKELLEVYIAKRLEEVYNEGIIYGTKNPY